MQDKFDLFTKLPEVIQTEAGQALSTSDLVTLSTISKRPLTLFTPVIDIRKMLHHVVRGNHDEVQFILNSDFKLIFKRGHVTDRASRTFKNISAFEYALWAKDKHMWTLMIECIAQNVERKKIAEVLLAQYDKVITTGVTYRLNGEAITENHFDLENILIKELQTQIYLANTRDSNWDTAERQWIKGVGSAQTLLPMHIVDEYTSSNPFYPVPPFTTRPQSSRQFYNHITKNTENWFSANSMVGIELAIYRGALIESSGTSMQMALVKRDLVTLQELWKVRTKDFNNLKSQLEKFMTVDNQHSNNQY